LDWLNVRSARGVCNPDTVEMARHLKRMQVVAMEQPVGFESLVPLGLAFLAADGKDYADLKKLLRTWAKDDPIDALLLTAFGGGIAFYLAERGKNPNIATPWDAILYAATCFSVGYDNTFPVTDAGHALATLIQTFGPALA